MTQTDRQTDEQTDRQTDRQTGRQTDRQTGRQTDRQIERQTDRQKHIHMQGKVYCRCNSLIWVVSPPAGVFAASCGRRTQKDTREQQNET